MPTHANSKSRMKRKRIQAMGQVEQRIADDKKALAAIDPKEDDANAQAAYTKRIERAEQELLSLETSLEYA